MGAALTRKGKYDPSKNNKKKKAQAQVVITNHYERDHFFQNDRKFGANRRFQGSKTFSQTMPDLTDLTDDSFPKRRIDPKTRLTLDPSQMYSERSMRSDDYETISVSLHNIPDTDDNIYEEVHSGDQTIDTDQGIDEEIAHIDIDEVVQKLKLIKKRIQTYDGSEDYHIIIEDLNDCEKELNDIDMKNEHTADLHRKIQQFRHAIEKLGKQKPHSAPVNEAIYENFKPSEDTNKSHYQSVITLFAEITNQLDDIKEEMLSYYGTSEDQEYIDIMNKLNTINNTVKDVDSRSSVNITLTKEQYEDYITRLIKQFEVIVEESVKNFKLQKHKISIVERSKDRRRRSQILDNNINIKAVHGRLSVDHSAGGIPVGLSGGSGNAIEEEVEDHVIYENILVHKHASEKVKEPAEEDNQSDLFIKENEIGHTSTINNSKQKFEEIKRENEHVPSSNLENKHEEDDSEDQILYAEVTKPNRFANTVQTMKQPDISLKETSTEIFSHKKDDHVKQFSPTFKNFRRQMSEYSTEADEEFFDCEEFLESDEFSVRETFNAFRTDSCSMINTEQVRIKEESPKITDDSKIFFMDETPPDDKPTFKSLFGRSISERSNSQSSEVKMRLNSEDSNSDQVEYQKKDSLPISNSFSDESSTQMQVEHHDSENDEDIVKEEEKIDVVDADPTKVKKPRKVSRITLKYINELKQDYAENLRNLSPSINTVDEIFTFNTKDASKDKEHSEDAAHYNHDQSEEIKKSTKPLLLPKPVHLKNKLATKAEFSDYDQKTNEAFSKDEKLYSFEDSFTKKRVSNETLHNTRQNSKEKIPSFIQFIPDNEISETDHSHSINLNNGKFKLQRDDGNTSFEQQEEFVEDKDYLKTSPQTPRNSVAGPDLLAKIQTREFINFNTVSDKLRYLEEEKEATIDDNAITFQDDDDNYSSNENVDNNIKTNSYDDTNDDIRFTNDNAKDEGIEEWTSQKIYDKNEILDHNDSSDEDDDIRRHETFYDINLNDGGAKPVPTEKLFNNPKETTSQQNEIFNKSDNILEPEKRVLKEREIILRDSFGIEQIININEDNLTDSLDTREQILNKSVNDSTDSLGTKEQTLYKTEDVEKQVLNKNVFGNSLETEGKDTDFYIRKPEQYSKIDTSFSHKEANIPQQPLIDLSQDQEPNTYDINTLPTKESTENINSKKLNVNIPLFVDEESENSPSPGLKLESLIKMQINSTSAKPSLQETKSEIMKPEIVTNLIENKQNVTDINEKTAEEKNELTKQIISEEGIYVNMDDLEVVDDTDFKSNDAGMFRKEESKHNTQDGEVNNANKDDSGNIDKVEVNNENINKHIAEEEVKINKDIYKNRDDADVYNDNINKQNTEVEVKTNRDIYKDKDKTGANNENINKHNTKERVQFNKNIYGNTDETEEDTNNEDNYEESNTNKTTPTSPNSSMEYLDEERDTLPELPSLTVRTYLVDNDMEEVQQKMNVVKECLYDIKMCVRCFEGTKNDEEYHNIYENLFSTMSVLNKIKSADWDVIQEKQRILQEINICMSELEAKVS